MLEGSGELHNTLDAYLRLVVRRRWWLLLPACVVTLATVFVLTQLPKMYRSETLILVEDQKVPEHYVVPNIATKLPNRLQTMTQQILSRTRLLRIVDEFGLYAKGRQKLAPEKLVELMRRDIEIELVGQGGNEVNAFRVSFIAPDPHLAQQVTSRLTSLFIEENLRVREQQSLGTTQFLKAQLKEARTELQELEKRMGEFKTRYLGELPEQQAGNLNALNGLQMQLQSLSAGLNRAREHRIYLESLQVQYRSLAEAGGSLAGVPAPTPAAAAENELTRLRSQRAALQARYTSQHPDIRKIDQEIAQAETLLAEMVDEQKETQKDSEPEGPTTSTSGSQTATAIAQVKSQLKANEAEILNLQAEEKRIQAEIRSYQARLNISPLREQQLADVVRDYSLSKQNYEGLLRKKMESELATNLEKRQQGEQFRILDPPSLPERPYNAKHRQINLAGVALGLGLAVGLTFLSEVRDGSVHTEQELASLVPLPLLVGVPELLTPAEERRRWWRRIGEWVAGSGLVLLVVAAELFVWKG